MKKSLLILLVIFHFKSAYSDCISCGGRGIEFFPKQKEISSNSMFIIQGYGSSQNTINSFENRRVYLESEIGEIIELNLYEILKGQMKLTQAIFFPASELKSNTKYFLKYPSQNQIEIIQYNREKEERKKAYWKTTDKKLDNSLNSNLNIEFTTTKVNLYGSGHSVNAIFNIKNKSKSEIWYKTELVEIATNKKTIYYIKEWNKTLNIGHEMCSGAFTYNKKGKYKVRFTPMNIDGKSLKTTDWTYFNSPFEDYKNIYKK